MNYEKNYKDALKRARELQKNSNGMILKKWLWGVFPELKEKESEDEQMIERLKSCVYASDITPEGSEEILAWLEEQKDYIKFPNSAYTSNKDVIEFADKYSHDIWEKLMDNFKKIENYSIGCNDVSDIVLNAIINTYNWLEKQGENKPTGKVEPKFKVGDGITDGYIYYKITEILDDRYIIKSKYDKRGAILFEHENRYHLWTIQDAKDGDVLVFNGFSKEYKWIGIFKAHTSDTSFSSHCHYNCGMCEFVTDIARCTKHGIKYNDIRPATNEERDILFAKMQEAGYEWDADKKELKKMEVVSKESEDERIRKGLIKAVSGILKGNTLYGTDVTREEALAWLEKQGEKKSADEVMEIRRKSYSDGYMHGQDNIAISLGKESVEALEHFVRGIGESGYASPYDNRTKLVYRLLEQLKQMVNFIHF